MTRNKIIKKSVVTLAAAAVLFAITSYVAEAAKINPNPMGKPSSGGTVAKPKNCLYEREVCRTGDYTKEDMEGCPPRRSGARCRLTNQKARCDIEHKKCKKTEKKATKTLPSTTGTIMKTVPMKQYKMAPTKQK